MGAGASYGARIDRNVKPPLGKDLIQFLKSATTKLEATFEACEFDFILAPAQSCLQSEIFNCDNFERAISQCRHDELKNLTRLIQVLFSGDCFNGAFDFGFHEGADLYDLLIDKEDFNEGTDIIVSLNYDILFEQALNRKKKSFRWSQMPLIFGENPKTGELQVVKPHGSINFIMNNSILAGDAHGAPPTQLTSYQTRDLNYGFHREKYLALLPSTETISTYAQDPQAYPIMANYTKYKEAEINLPTLTNIREHFFSSYDFSQTELIVIGTYIGNPDPEDDPFLTKLLKLPFQRFKFIGTAHDEENVIKYAEHISGKKEFFLNGLKGYLESHPQPNSK